MSSINSIFSIAGNGLTRASNQMTVAAQKIVNDTASSGSVQAQAGGLAEHLVDLISEKTAFEASALVLKTGEKMVGSLLDMLDSNPDRQ